MSDEIVEVIHDCTDWCGIYVRSVLLQKAGMMVEQHTHQFDHLTYCGAGSAEFFEDGIKIGNVYAGQGTRIRAGKKHYFVALEDNTRLACIHDATSAMEQRKF